MKADSRVVAMRYGIALAVLGIIGVIASSVLLYDTIELQRNADYVPGCNISPFISCSSVMASEQAELFGVPNPVFGVIAFVGLLIFGLLVARGVAVPRRLWLAALMMAVLGVVFAHYLFVQSIFFIRSICPWCSLVWVIVIMILWLIVSYVLQQRMIGTERLRLAWQRYRWAVLAAWYVVLVAIVFVRFSDYWLGLL